MGGASSPTGCLSLCAALFPREAASQSLPSRPQPLSSPPPHPRAQVGLWSPFPSPALLISPGVKLSPELDTGQAHSSLWAEVDVENQAQEVTGEGALLSPVG